MLDKFNRNINYLRISVTDRCNLRCRYCMPEQGIKLIRHEDILSYEEIVNIVKEATKLGFYKIRLTGGEPLIRRRIVNLVRMISQIHEVNDLAMTTNGILLDKYAKQLKEAGLQRLNISLDTLDPEKYKYLTRGGNIKLVLNGIQEAIDAGFFPIKINCVITESIDKKDINDINQYCKKNNLEVRFIREMNIKDGKYHIFKGGTGGQCNICNRLRITSDGKIITCLFNDNYISIKELGIKEALKKAVALKPEKGNYSNINCFYSIGG